MTSPTNEYDLIIRGGLVVDGTGGMPFPGDVGVRDGVIVEIGSIVTAGRAEIAADGCLVTPGFVDVHTHYDGQAIWSSNLDPSSNHGVTTVVMGNCGVGFAPCRSADKEVLVNVMEGVEDIPEVVMVEGLSWEWETFPEFLNALEARPHDVNIAAYIPHSALRLYVMGDRGAAGERATPDDLARMKQLILEALAAGAMGFSTSRFHMHRRGDGEQIPSFGAAEEELLVAAEAIREFGSGMMQLIPEAGQSEDEAENEIRMFGRLSRTAGATLTFTLLQTHSHPERWRNILKWVSEENATPGCRIVPQIYPRPLGVLLGLEMSYHPFFMCPSYIAIADLPLDERVKLLADPETRAKLLSESQLPGPEMIQTAVRNFEYMYELGNPPNYEPKPDQSIAARAAQLGVSPLELAYDLLLKDGGKTVFLFAAVNYAYSNMDHFAEMFAHPATLIGLGDGGAHYGLICDSSYPTTLLTHWTKERPGNRIDLPKAVQALTALPAELIGLSDRGTLRPGLRADINIIEFDNLELLSPRAIYDLPTGRRRLMQLATGYRATIVAGQTILADGERTGRLPGKLIRAGHSIAV